MHSRNFSAKRSVLHPFVITCLGTSLPKNSNMLRIILNWAVATYLNFMNYFRHISFITAAKSFLFWKVHLYLHIPMSNIQYLDISISQVEWLNLVFSTIVMQQLLLTLPVINPPGHCHWSYCRDPCCRCSQAPHLGVACTVRILPTPLVLYRCCIRCKSCWSWPSWSRADTPVSCWPQSWPV